MDTGRGNDRRPPSDDTQRLLGRGLSRMCRFNDAVRRIHATWNAAGQRRHLRSEPFKEKSKPRSLI